MKLSSSGRARPPGFYLVARCTLPAFLDPPCLRGGTEMHVQIVGASASAWSCGASIWLPTRRRPMISSRYWLCWPSRFRQSRTESGRRQLPEAPAPVPRISRLRLLPQDVLSSFGSGEMCQGHPKRGHPLCLFLQRKIPPRTGKNGLSFQKRYLGDLRCVHAGQ